ncbi:DNA-3-methyladenine glycosylase [Elusimicrobium minutum Pei191]|uniref:DNA-3-methyladenine glycosylase I n=1 Tax=Elusimicrobium minutum (strain Pei191) TaxID=445932 RepID=B2KCA6_ELUMP|nr:DNA-3-methyladenine glycosylase I [Elusimicrobium minutum]ACC98233.1 DNA-3-methyladenine glycosylase [Elusimicrobium minutum Pei191]
MNKKICPWASTPLYEKYHNEEWGKPLHDDRELFEMFILEGMQAGLSWITVLNKREYMRKVFDNFDAVKIAKYTESKKQALLKDPGIIRNRLKINALVQNAKAYLEVKKEFGSFDKFIWQFVKGKQIINKFTDIKQAPARTELSDAMSKELLKRGFKFAGSTICYAYMQAVGMVNDHMTWCKEYNNLKRK